MDLKTLAFLAAVAKTYREAMDRDCSSHHPAMKQIAAELSRLMPGKKDRGAGRLPGT